MSELFCGKYLKTYKKKQQKKVQRADSSGNIAN